MQNLSYEKQIYWHENKKNTHIFISCYALSLSLKQRLGVTLSCVLITIIEYDSCGKGIICWLITLVVRVLSNYRVQLKRSPSCDLQVMSSGVANRLLGFLRRSAFETHDQRARKLLYLSLVRSNLEYCSQMWAPQAANLILDIERIQRRATKFIPPLPYRSEVSYEQRLLKIGLLLRFGVRIQMFS